MSGERTFLAALLLFGCYFESVKAPKVQREAETEEDESSSYDADTEDVDGGHGFRADFQEPRDGGLLNGLIQHNPEAALRNIQTLGVSRLQETNVYIGMTSLHFAIKCLGDALWKKAVGFKNVEDRTVDLYFELIMTLLNDPAIDVRLCDMRGRTPLHCIFDYWLCPSEALRNSKTKIDQSCWLRWHERVEGVVATIVKLMHDFNIQDENGDTVLHKADEIVQSGYPCIIDLSKMIKLFYISGAVPMIPNNQGRICRTLQSYLHTVGSFPDLRTPVVARLFSEALLRSPEGEVMDFLAHSGVRSYRESDVWTALLCKQPEDAKQLIQEGAVVPPAEKDFLNGMTPLHFVIRKVGDLMWKKTLGMRTVTDDSIIAYFEIIFLLLRGDFFDKAAPDNDGATALHYIFDHWFGKMPRLAATGKRVKLHYWSRWLGFMEDIMVAMIKSVGEVGVNKRDSEGNTPLHKAAAVLACTSVINIENVISLLCTFGADPNIRNAAGRECLSARQYHRIVRDFSLGAIANQCSPERVNDLRAPCSSTESELWTALLANRPDDAARIIKESDPVPQRREFLDGKTPLHFAIEHVANLMMRNFLGLTTATPENIACISSFLSVCHLLLDRHGSSYRNMQDNAGRTPLHYVLQHLWGRKVLNLNVQFCENVSPWKSWQEYHQKWRDDMGTFLVKLFLGADLSLADEDGNTVVHEAIRLCSCNPPQRMIFLFNLLARNGGDFTRENKAGESAESLARQYKGKDFAYVKELIKGFIAEQKRTRR